jgi:hypothetical protein
MPDSTLSEAIKEAYASAPVGVINYFTLEFRHSLITSPIRVVRDSINLEATLEAGAPLNPGEAVTFIAYGFDITKAEVSAQGVPQVHIEIDNVDRSIVSSIEAVLASTEPVQLTFREYISTDLTTPQNDPPLHMEVMSVTADVFRVKIVAGWPNLMNKRFPTTAYNSYRFPALASA